jgi:uncharacterized protein YfbU (UPF0304 family)
MSMAEELLKNFEELPEDKKREVFDFIEFLKTKTNKEVNKMMDMIIEENKPALEDLGKQ